MIRPRYRKVLSDLWINPTRSLLVIASIAVGLFALGTIATIHYSISSDMLTGYAAANPANIQIITSLFDQELVEGLRQVEGVREVEGARNFGLRLEARPGEWIAINLRALHDPQNVVVSKLLLLQGAWPPADHQVVIERYRLPDTYAGVGDTVRVEMLDGQVRQLQLTGVVNEQSLGAFEPGGGFFMAPVQGYVTQETAGWLGQPRPYAFNTLYATVSADADSTAHLHEVASRLRAKMEEAGVTVVSVAVRGAADHPNRTFSDAVAGLLFVLGLLVVFLSGFLITNTLQALVAQQMQQIGIMKTVGGRRWQIILVYMSLILAFSLAAIVIAVPLAYQIGFRIVQALVIQINVNFQGFRIIPDAILLQIAVGLLAPQIAAAIPILAGSRLTIQEALSGINQGSAASTDHLTAALMRLRGLSRPTAIALRNTFRRKSRLLLTLITLSLGGAIFIATFNVQVSMSDYVDRVSRYFLGDVNLTLAYPYRIDDMQRLLAGIPDISYMEGWTAARSELVLENGEAGESVTLLGPPPDSRLVQPILLEGRWIQPGDRNAVAINERFVQTYPELRIGDTLRLNVNGKETDWVVVGFFQLAGKSSGLLAYVSYDYLSEILHQPNKAITFRFVSHQPDMTMEQQKALGRVIEERLKRQGLEIKESQAGKFVSASAAQGFNTLTGFLLFLAGLTAVVGSIGLAGAMSMNVMERTREIGVMRAIGASDAILMRMVLLEGLTIGLVSWVISAGLAFPITRLLADVVSNALFGSTSGYVLTPTGFVLWLGIVLLLAIIASVLPARSASRLTIREVLAYE